MASVRRVARSAPQGSSGCCNGGLTEPASSRDPHPVFGQMFYVPPPPPLVHWPMPLSYNPFPSMSYDMVYPPPFYMRAPAYILPHPHVQPVDYRRLLHPHVGAQSASNQNLTSRHHQPQSVPIATVSSEVQTEPERSSGGDHDVHLPQASIDSGKGTASTSPCSSDSSSPKKHAGAPDYELPSCDDQVNEHDRSYSGAEKEIQTNKDDDGQNLLDVSIWSVESVAPYFPSREWLMANGLATPDDDEIKTQTQEHAEETRGERRKSFRFPFCSEMLDSCMSEVYNENQSLPKENKLEVEQDISFSEQREPEEGQTVADLEEYTLSLPTLVFSQDVNTEGEAECPGPDPEAAEGLNPESPVKEQQEQKSPGVSPELILFHSPAEEKAETSNGTGLNIHKLSPSKGHLVDFGVQCSELQLYQCVCEESEMRFQLKNSDLKIAKNNEVKTFSKNRRVQRKSSQRRNRH